MHRFQYRRRIEGDPWINCTEAKVRDLLNTTDPDTAFDYLEQGQKVATGTHEIRINPKLLMVQRTEPTPDETGEILWA